MPSPKKRLRSQLLATREALDPIQIAEESRQVCQRIMELPQWQDANYVLTYMPHRREMDLRPLMEKAWVMGKKVVLPRALPAKRSLSFYEVNHFRDITIGVYGIQEPLAKEEARIDPKVLDLALVPGVAFDHHGYRLGYGGGYYDRFFAGEGSSIVRYGVAYSFQWVNSVYPEGHDIPMDGVVKPDGLILSQRDIPK
ncbi:5-formyltetrahydrofolate cyclo-ligase [Marininema halotolerans]|uniref:5-formyltetrahydrofolate cyclo-ligase n=1 Tax=Marininema halotolerans TaxID=1155944 RepID=A0A1I6TMY7_9BACL|nr:5-formyltetrahydrofolate cyclo-ligase [Marininema halotolerans]SFS90500.1 5-formyltetrahydrofolate cyclo-ligase [Marininema halotolerans]